MVKMATSNEAGEQKADIAQSVSMETWDPMEEAFNDPRCNVYTSGPGANMDSTLQPYNRRSTEKERVYKLYINGLPQGITKRGLTNIFYNFGTPWDVAICRNAETGHQYGFVSYKTEKEAEKAIRELHLKPPIRLRVEFARSEEDKARILKEEAQVELLCKIMKDMGQYKGPTYTPKFPCRMNVAIPGTHDKRADYLADQLWYETAVPHGAGYYCPYVGNYSSSSSRVVLRCLTTDNSKKKETGHVVTLGRGYYRPSKCPVELPGRSQKFTKLEGSEDMWVYGQDVPLRTGKCVRCTTETPHYCKRCNTWYCSRDCQLDDWSQHKECCRRLSTSPKPSCEQNESTKKVSPSGGRGRSRLSSVLRQLLTETGASINAQQTPEQINPKPSLPTSELVALMQPSIDDQLLPVCELSITLRLLRGMSGTGKMHRSYGGEFTAVLDYSSKDAATIAQIHNLLCDDNNSDEFHPEEGDLVAVRSTDTGKWSRGHVLKVLKTGYVVALCDVGSVEVADKVRQLPDKFRNVTEHVVTVCAGSSHKITFKKNAAFSYEVVNREGSEVMCVFTMVDSGERYTVSVLPWQPLPEDTGLKTVPLEDGDPVIITSFFDQEDIYLRPTANQHMLQGHLVLSATAAYADLHGRQLGPKGPRVGEMVACQFSGDGIYYRALVVAVHESSYTVAYVDFGNQEAVSLDKMRALNSPLKQHPCYAVRASLKDVSGKTLTSTAAKYLTQLVEEETVLRLELQGSVSEGVKLYCDRKCINEDVKELLQEQWRKELASDVPPASCSGGTLRYVTLPVGRTVPLVVLAVLDEDETGDLTVAGCQADDEAILYVYQKLLREINLYAYHSKAKMFVPRVGDACIAKNTDDVWHRALCVELKREEVVVMLVDVGTMIRIPYYHIRSIVAEFTEAPALGLLCRFQGMTEEMRKLLTPHSVHMVQVVSYKDEEYLVELVQFAKQ